MRKLDRLSQDKHRSILCDRAHSAALAQPDVQGELIESALPLMGAADLRLACDAYCFLGRLLVAYGCDRLLFDFGRGVMRGQLRSRSTGPAQIFDR